MPSRAPLIDVARGLAVVAMVIFHFAWDLSHFNVIATDVSSHPGWRLFSQAIAASFLLITGVALERATRGGIRWPHFLRRLGIIGGAALAVTIGSYFAFPQSYIFFGILHAIAAFSVLALAFMRWPIWAVALLAVAVFVLPQLWRSDVFNGLLIWTGLGTDVPFTNDFEPLFPWFAFVLAGVALGKLRLAALESTAPVAGTAILTWLGRWSLIIYLVHQPLLFGAMAAMQSAGLLPDGARAGRFEADCTANCRRSARDPAICAPVCACTLRGVQGEAFWRERRAMTEADLVAMNRITQRCMVSPQ